MSDEEHLQLDDFPSICRTCLHRYDADSLLSINELYVMDGEIRLLDILLKYTQMEEKENYPQQICGDCILRAEDAFCFLTKCNESELILSQFGNMNEVKSEDILDMFNNGNNDHDESNNQGRKFEIIKVIDDENQENVEIKIILDEHGSKEEDIDESSQVDSSDEKPTLDHTGSLSANYYAIEKCKFCNMEIELEFMEEHKSRYGHYDECELIKCPHCNIPSKNITNFKLHLRKYHSNRKESKKYACQVCSQVFKWSKNYEEHMKNHNLNPEETVMCPECGILLTNVTALQIHRGKEHLLTLNQAWTCRHCREVFDQITEFKRHLREIHCEKDFHCIICGKDCEDKRTLYYHEQLHLDEYGIECSYCQKKLLTEKKFVLHQRIHKYVKKKHVCTFCNKGFRQLDKLEAHERVHTGEKPFTCDDCGKAFNHQNNLMHHRRVHTGDTPYKCLFCSKEFSNSHSLRKHMSTHEDSMVDDRSDMVAYQCI